MGGLKAIAGTTAAELGVHVTGLSVAHADPIGVLAGGAIGKMGLNTAVNGADQGLKGLNQRAKTHGMEGLIAKGQGKSPALGMRGMSISAPQLAPVGGRLSPGQAAKLKDAQQHYDQSHMQGHAAPQPEQAHGKKKGWGNKARAAAAAAQGKKWNGPTE